MDISKIIKPNQMQERYVDVSYINNEKKVITTKVDVLSAKQDNPNDDWNRIKEKSLVQFADSTSGFKSFFYSDLKEVKHEELTPDFLLNYGDLLFNFNNKLYLLK